MKINKQELLDALSLVAPALDEKSVIEDSDYFLFEDDIIAAYNTKICIIKEFKTGLKGAIIGDPFRKLLGKISNDEVSLSITKTKGLGVKAGKASFGFLYSEAEPLRQMVKELGFDEVKRWQKLHEGLKEAIITSSFSTTTELVYPELTGIAVQGSDVMSSDRFRITWQHLPEGEGFSKQVQVLIPARSAVHLLDCDFSHYCLKDGWIYFHSKKEKVYLAIRLLQSEFPIEKCKELFPKKQKPDLTLEMPDELPSVLDKALVILEEDSLLNKLVHMTVSGKTLTCEAKKKEVGWFEEKLTLKKAVGKVFSFSVNPMFLKQVMKHTSTLMLFQNNLVFTSDGFKHRMSLKKAVVDEDQKKRQKQMF